MQSKGYSSDYFLEISPWNGNIDTILNINDCYANFTNKLYTSLTQSPIRTKTPQPYLKSACISPMSTEKRIRTSICRSNINPIKFTYSSMIQKSQKKQKSRKTPSITITEHSVLQQHTFSFQKPLQTKKSVTPKNLTTVLKKFQSLQQNNKFQRENRQLKKKKYLIRQDNKQNWKGRSIKASQYFRQLNMRILDKRLNIIQH